GERTQRSHFTRPLLLRVAAEVEVESADAVLPVVDRPGLVVDWQVRPDGEAPGFTLVAAARSISSADSDTHVWAAGEAASMQAIRKHCFDELDLPRSQTTIRGYWKPARD
ncbi:MAG: SIP domain-containing protein, partial [Actinomycetota bacterium]